MGEQQATETETITAETARAKNLCPYCKTACVTARPSGLQGIGSHTIRVFCPTAGCGYGYSFVDPRYQDMIRRSLARGRMARGKRRSNGDDG